MYNKYKKYNWVKKKIIKINQQKNPEYFLNTFFCSFFRAHPHHIIQLRAKLVEISYDKSRDESESLSNAPTPSASHQYKYRECTRACYIIFSSAYRNMVEWRRKDLKLVVKNSSSEKRPPRITTMASRRSQHRGAQHIQTTYAQGHVIFLQLTRWHYIINNISLLYIQKHIISMCRRAAHIPPCETISKYINDDFCLLSTKDTAIQFINSITLLVYTFI